MNPPPPQWAACIGRFQLFHNAQLALIREGLRLAPRCAVLVGSAHQARSPRNPFTWQERAEAIRLALEDEEKARVDFLPLRDTWDPERWVRQVRAADGTVDRIRPHAASSSWATARIRPASTCWIFPAGRCTTWAGSARCTARPCAPPCTPAGRWRRRSPPSRARCRRPCSTSCVRGRRLPFLPRLRQEWAELALEHDKWAMAPYPPVFVTVDAVVRIGDEVLLIRRGRAPGKGLLALPGGFIEQRETAWQSAVRELEEETGFSLLPSEMEHACKAMRIFDHPDRSQRGRVITHAFHFDFGQRLRPEIAGSDDAAEARWVPIAELPALEEQFHDDHFHILDAFLGITDVPSGS